MTQTTKCIAIHCGHPTALWPWYLLDGDGRMILSPNGLGFQTKAMALAAAELLDEGHVEIVFRVCLAGRTKKSGLMFDTSRFVVMVQGHGAKLEGRPIAETVEMLVRKARHKGGAA